MAADAEIDTFFNRAAVEGIDVILQ